MKGEVNLKISESCYALTGLSFIPPLPVNAGLVVGRKYTLVIDTGANTLSAQTIYGYANAVNSASQLIVVNTEEHLDHMGGNFFFCGKGIDIYGHYSISREENDMKSLIEEYNQSIQWPERKKKNEAKIIFKETRVTNPNKSLFGDTTVELGGIEARLIMTPGHTPGNISVYVPSERVLFCGDCILNELLPNTGDGKPEMLFMWLNSLDRIEKINPQIIVPGHGQLLWHKDIGREIKRIRTYIKNCL